MSKPDEWDHRYAVDAVLSILGGEAEDRDVPGGPPAMHDFDVHLADGRIVAVEVTRFTDNPRVQQLAEIQKRSPWLFPDLEHGWHLTIEEDAQIRRLYKEVGSPLRVLESKGIDRLRTTVRPESDADEETKQAVTKLAELGVLAAWALDAIPPGLLIPAPRQAAGSTGQDLIIEMINAMADNKGDRLARADTDERHLFVWVEYAQAMTMAALAVADGTVPGVVLPDPILPASIDALWLVDAGFPTAIRLYQKGHGWMVRGPWQPRT